MKLFLTASILALALAGSAFADAAAGKALYATKCKMCHGANGEGNPGIAKALGATPKPLASKEVQSKSDAVLKQDIAAGVGKMKPVKLSDAEVKDVLGFVRTLK